METWAATRGTAAICGTTHKTVRRILEAHDATTTTGAAAGSTVSEEAGRSVERTGRVRNYDEVADLVAEGQEDRGPDLGEAAAARRAGGGLCRVAAELPPARRRRQRVLATWPGPRWWASAGGVDTRRHAGHRLGRRATRRAGRACVLCGAGRRITRPYGRRRRSRPGRLPEQQGHEDLTPELVFKLRRLAGHWEAVRDGKPLSAGSSARELRPPLGKRRTSVMFVPIRDKNRS